MLVKGVAGGLGLTQAGVDLLTMALSYGLLFAVLTTVKRMGYRELLHPAAHSPGATFVLVVPPLALLVPALLLVDDLVTGLLVQALPMSGWEKALFDSMYDGRLPMAV